MDFAITMCVRVGSPAECHIKQFAIRVVARLHPFNLIVDCVGEVIKMNNINKVLKE